MLEVIVVEDQLEAAAGRRSEGLLGIVAEAVVIQPATRRVKWEGAATRHGRVGSIGRAADSRYSRVVLLLSASARAMPPCDGVELHLVPLHLGQLKVTQLRRRA